jgi:glycosyltransferase involved in cell wall biosynthesis
MNVPRVAVVVPVFNRSAELRRALVSVQAQTLTDFECIVVDDASEDSIEPVVREFDDRFRYMRREANGGCTVARLDGFRHCKGTYATTLDSDNELYPWTLERAAGLLGQHASADCVTGLYVFPEGLRTRIDGYQLLMTPGDYMISSSLGVTDCLGVVRKHVVERWLTRRTDYFNLDAQMWFGMSLEFNQLYIDEPWAVYHMDGADRITDSPDERKYSDPVKFVNQYRSELGTKPCRPLDEYLQAAWVRLWRNRRSEEADVVRAWMDERGVSPRRAIMDLGWRKVRRRIAPPGPKVMTQPGI